MKVNKIVIGLGIVSLICHISCKKSFLDTPQLESPVRQEYVNNLSGCADFLRGIYIDLSLDFFRSYNCVYADLVSDNIKPASVNSPFYSHYSWTQLSNESLATGASPSSLNMNGLWTTGYKIIRNCNFLIENINRFRSGNPFAADTIKGQAYAIRALIHHFLVNVFAQPYNFSANASHPGIPYVLVSDYTQKVTRQTVSEVYAYLIDDLKNAIQLLPGTAKSTLFMNQAAAKALLARVFLFIRNFSEAKNYARQVAANVPIIKTGYPNVIWNKKNDFSGNESLFQLPPSSSGYITSFPSIFYRSTIQFLATSDIVSILLERPNDSRKNWVSQSGGNWIITKFPMGAVPGITDQAGAYYQTILRSSEMYLVAAESYAKLGGTYEDSARFYLDEIRRRSDATVISSNATGGALLDSISKERRKELTFEGFRLFDLLRNGKGISRGDALNPLAINLSYPNDKAISPIHAFDVQYYNLQQNSGY